MFLETSAKTAYNIMESFGLSAQCILNNIEKGGEVKNSGVSLNKKLGNKDNEKKCC